MVYRELWALTNDSAMGLNPMELNAVLSIPNPNLYPNPTLDP